MNKIKPLYLTFTFFKNNIFFSIVSFNGKLLYTSSLGSLGLKNFKYFNIRYINLFLENKFVRSIIKSLHYCIIKIKGIFKSFILVRILNLVKKLRLNVLGVNFKAAIPFNGCKSKI